MKAVQVKICGITTVPDAEACVRAGADMIGLNFYVGSPRFTDAQRARQIVEALSTEVETVGVFVDGSAAEIRAAASSVGLKSVQLHGRIDAEECRSLGAEFRVIRAFRTEPAFAPHNVVEFCQCDVLIDAFHRHLRGGTGELCDWTVARQVRPFVRFFILGGGLNPENVTEAIAAVLPDAVDVCSAVEKSPGVKDHDAIEDFVAAVRRAGNIVPV